MPIQFDPAKDEQNREKHGIGLGDFAGFDAGPIIKRDERQDYGEERLRAFGRIGGLPYCLVFTYRGADVRLISLRRMHEEELSEHEPGG